MDRAEIVKGLDLQLWKLEQKLSHQIPTEEEAVLTTKQALACYHARNILRKGPENVIHI